MFFVSDNSIRFPSVIFRENIIHAPGRLRLIFEQELACFASDQTIMSRRGFLKQESAANVRN
jgi:hypothetical protein